MPKSKSSPVKSKKGFSSKPLLVALLLLIIGFFVKKVLASGMKEPVATSNRKPIKKVRK